MEGSPEEEGPAGDGMVLFLEEGSPCWPVVVGPLLALGGGLLESTAPGGAVWGLWAVVAVIVGGGVAIVVRARRRFLRVMLTPTLLVQGSTTLPVASIARVVPDDGSGAYGIRVLGDGPVVPRKYDGIVLTLVDGVQRVAWARDGEGLRRALRSLVGPAASTAEPSTPAPSTPATSPPGPEQQEADDPDEAG